MSDCADRLRRGDVPGLPVALGVLWSPPASPARRRLSPRLLLPGGRKIGGTRRRGRHSIRQLHIRPPHIRPLYSGQTHVQSQDPTGAACLALSAWS